MRDTTPRDGEVYLEHHTRGAFRRVVAIDATTGIEVSVLGPLNAAPGHLERLAIQKLRRRVAIVEPPLQR